MNSWPPTVWAVNVFFINERVTTVSFDAVIFMTVAPLSVSEQIKRNGSLTKWV